MNMKLEILNKKHYEHLEILILLLKDVILPDVYNIFLGYSIINNLCIFVSYMFYTKYLKKTIFMLTTHKEHTIEDFRENSVEDVNLPTLEEIFIVISIWKF